MASTKLFVALVIGLSGLLSAGSCPTIVSRSEWNARPPTGTSPMKNPVAAVVVHHTAMGECYIKQDCVQVMKGIQDFHQFVRGWDDIGYSFLVGGDGNLYEGRGWSRVGAHAPGQNDKSIGISLIGTFTSELPNELQLNATQQLIKCGVEKGYVVPTYTLMGHRDAVNYTECPGDALYQEISSWPHFHTRDTANLFLKSAVT